MKNRIVVIDLFSGSGGLGEGFSAYGGSEQPFRVDLSVEKEPAAAATLTLRKFFRQFAEAEVPDEYYDVMRSRLSVKELYKKFPVEAEAAKSAVHCEELGPNNYTDSMLHEALDSRLGDKDKWVLIGGPPCQAYSMAGRARNRGIKGYEPKEDKRHYLYLEYLRVIERHWPAVFVMENVPGLLSTKIDGESMFGRILTDLTDPQLALQSSNHYVRELENQSDAPDGYRLYSLVTRSLNFSLFGDVLDQARSSDFVVRAENYGIPQARHRVFIIGVRTDIDAEPGQLSPCTLVNVEDVLCDLPKIRSGLSKDDSSDRWYELICSVKNQPWWQELVTAGDHKTMAIIEATINSLKRPKNNTGGMYVDKTRQSKPKKLADWYLDPRLTGVANHESRSHMDSDIHRYLYASSFVKGSETEVKAGRVSSAILSKMEDFPTSLLPEHKNVQKAQAENTLKKVAFSNRFQVQRAKAPSSTVVSHIARDGHYYIHYDPSQCRSLTVREAARLQTFPDNYFFCGNRTEQYIQVGNAVPPLLARSIAEIVYNLLNND